MVFFFFLSAVQANPRGPRYIHRLSVPSAISIPTGLIKHARVRLKRMFCQIDRVRLFRLKQLRYYFYRSQDCARRGHRFVLFGKKFGSYNCRFEISLYCRSANIPTRPYCTDNTTTRKKTRISCADRTAVCLLHEPT